MPKENLLFIEKYIVSIIMHMLLNSFLLPIHGEPNSLALLIIVEAHKQIVEVAFFPSLFLA